MSNLQPNEQRAKNVQYIFWGMLGLSVIGAFSDWMQFNLLNSESFDEASASANDTRQSIIGMAQLGVFIAAIVLFIMWFRRAYANLHRIGTRLRYEEGWAAGSWFVPFLNLVRPYQIMVEIWEETQRSTTGKDQIEPAGIVGWWWGAYLISNFFDNITFRMTMGADTLEELSSASLMGVVGQVLEIPSILLVIYMVKKSSEFEAALYTSRHEMSIDDHLIDGGSGGEV